MNRLIYYPILVLLLSSCASLPQIVSVPDAEGEAVLHAFNEFSKQQCPKDIDVDVALTFDNLLFKGTIKGYLQAMEPAFVRFEGVNPLGLTESILTSDGEEFTFLAVREQKGYVGRLDAKKVRKYVSTSVASSFNYHWLLGAIFPFSQLDLIGGDSSGTGYWLQLEEKNAHAVQRVLFDLDDKIIRRRMIIDNNNGIDVDITYAFAASSFSTQGEDVSSATCTLPSSLAIDSKGNGRITLTFQKRYPSEGLKPSLFDVPIPQDFERIVIQ